MPTGHKQVGLAEVYRQIGTSVLSSNFSSEDLESTNRLEVVFG